MENITSFKIVLLGKSAVGKSSLVIRFVQDKFYDSLENTIGAAFLTKTVVIEEKETKLEIWDTAGAERYRSLTPMYYRDAVGALVVFDLTCEDSYEEAKSWLKEMSLVSSVCAMLLIGNKSDLEERCVSEEEAKKTADSFKAEYVETSAKFNSNVAPSFRTLASLILKRKPEVQPSKTKLIQDNPSPGSNDSSCVC